MRIEKINLYINTLKYLKASQFYHRGFFQAKRKVIFKSAIWKKAFSQRLEKQIETLSSINLIEFVIDESVLNSLDKIHFRKEKKRLINKEFSFLNKEITFQGELGWHDSNLSQLWKYNLHYFDYFRRLIEIEIVDPDTQNYELLKEYVNSWIKNNEQVGIGDGWHPYTISLRLVNWIFTYSAFKDYLKNDSHFNDLFLKSIILQSEFLMKNREYDVVGNHLFENLKTLIICGMFFGNNDFGKNYKEVGEKELLKQLREQFLQDGGHFELSAMYHSILLKGLIELIHVYKKLDYQVPKDFIDTRERALNYLKNVIHPDGDIPLFNDAAFDIADSPQYIFELASNEKMGDSTLLLFDKLLKTHEELLSTSDIGLSEAVFYAKESGYLRTSDQIIFSIIDIGKPCPEYLPAHAHADIFSYELSYKGNRLIVDTGTYEYAGTKREFDRATQSHNTLSINRANQSQVWGSFRVAERATPTIHSFVKEEYYTAIHASHDGFLKKYGARHYRKYIHAFNEAIIVLDYANSKEKIESFVHFHPSCQITEQDNSILLNNANLLIKPINASIGFEESIYHPKFGVEEENKKLVLTPITSGIFGYYISFGDGDISVKDDNITLTSREKKLIFDLRMEK